MGVCGIKLDTYEEAPVESLASLTFDGIMRGTPLSGVSPSRGFALGLRMGRTQRAGRRISCGRSGRLIRRRERQGWDGITRRHGRLRGVGGVGRGRRRGRGDRKRKGHSRG